MPAPVLILAADHRARGIVTVENYRRYVEVISSALPACDGILATMQPLRDLLSSATLRPGQKTYLSLNRTGLGGSAFELDDRLVTSVSAAVELGASGVKHMTRIDVRDPLTAPALELLGKVLEGARAAGIEAMIEAITWRQGAVARDTDSIVFAAVVANDMGAPVLKVPVPDTPEGPARVDAVSRIVQSVGVPVLFLGGPRGPEGARVGDPAAVREAVLGEMRDVMAGGAAGVALGRVVLEDPDPRHMASLVAEVVRSQR